jgi:hypothetical protein
VASVVLTPVRQGDHWRVKMKWLKKTPRYFGQFKTEAEAAKWIEEHQRLIDRPQDPDETSPDTP